MGFYPDLKFQRLAAIGPSLNGQNSTPHTPIRNQKWAGTQFVLRNKFNSPPGASPWRRPVIWMLPSSVTSPVCRMSTGGVPEASRTLYGSWKQSG
ncbi:hypothetical protein EYZ11_012999 [Aspergillus tanneri]|uniref:Uncharacterized protein n=1 Tax=Aspergillus tanneri TaxID=1220188 RepID=A0A4S3IYS7_9EURO|nr:hypothetical protein EYZ11_012999 [Aspergillus tanneri]